MAPTNETAKECCRCRDTLTLHDEAAWDGHGNSLCFPCFRAYGWTGFPFPVAPHAHAKPDTVRVLTIEGWETR